MTVEEGLGESRPGDRRCRGIQRPEWSLPGTLVRVRATEQSACLTRWASALSPT